MTIRIFCNTCLPSGLKNHKYIVTKLFQYIKSFDINGINKELWEEKKKIDELKFRFKEKEDPAAYARFKLLFFPSLYLSISFFVSLSIYFFSSLSIYFFASLSLCIYSFVSLFLSLSLISYSLPKLMQGFTCFFFVPSVSFLILTFTFSP